MSAERVLIAIDPEQVLDLARSLAQVLQWTQCSCLRAHPYSGKLKRRCPRCTALDRYQQLTKEKLQNGPSQLSVEDSGGAGD
jgi:hypothetical protein